MRRSLPTLLPLLTALLALQAGAAPKVTLLKFTGPRGPQARTALAGVVCQRVQCVEPEFVTTRFVPDWKKAGPLSVGVMVTGVAARVASSVELTVQVIKDGQDAGTQKFELPKEGLSEAALASLADSVLAAAGLAPERPAQEAPTKVAPEPVATEPTPAAPAAVVQPALEAPASSPAGRYAFAGELGVNAANRSFDYLGARVPELRRYSLPVVALVNARLEWFPFVSSGGALQGLGLELAGNVAPWIRSAPPNSTDSLPTFTSRTDAALQWRLVPARGVAITPLLGLRFHTFTVMGATEGGQQIDGLPNLAYFAVRAGLGTDVRFAGDRLVVFARVAALPLLSAGEILSPAYFPRGWAVGVEATGGLGVKIVDGVEVRLSADWTRYMFWFDTNLATSAFYARGAFDQYLGGTALVRFEL